MGFSAIKRFAVLLVLALGLAVPVAAQADTPAHTDVMFVFDTTGSMGGALTEAKEEIQTAMSQIGATLPDVEFGLAEMRDYNTVNFNGFPQTYAFEGNPSEKAFDIESENQPWTLKRPITADQAAIVSALSPLSASGGGDSPEAYGRALYETDSNPAVGWRPGARGVIVLIADNVPHDGDLNDGIPSSLFAAPSPFYTSPDPGVDNTLGTADDLDWQSIVLPKLISDGRPLEYVDYFGQPEYFPYWQNWTARTGGSALQANGESLAGQIVELVKAGAAANLPVCPAGQIRDANSHCVVPPPPPPVSNSFKIEPRISCAKGCYVVEVKIVFDSAGRVIAESVIGEEPARGSSAGISAAKKGGKKGKRKPRLIKTLRQNVKPGPNTLKLKLTGAAKEALRKKGSVKLKVKFSFTPTGGTLKSVTHTFSVKAPARKPVKKHGSGK